MRRFIWIIVVIGILAGAWFATRPRGVVVVVTTVARNDVASIVEERGTTRLNDTYDITMPVDGRILAITLREGDAVDAGQIVAAIDPVDLAERINEVQARIDRLDASIARTNDDRLERTALEQIDLFLVSIDQTVEAAREGVTASLARHEFFVEELRRNEEAFEREASNITQLRRARLDAIEKESEYRSDVLTLRASEAVQVASGLGPRFIREMIAKKALSAAELRADKQEAKATLRRLTHLNDRTQITSPVDGVVLEVHHTSERDLPVGALLLTIGSLDDLEVEAELLTQDAARVNIGDPVNIRIDDQHHASGTVRLMHPEGFTKISSLGVEQQRILVRIAFTENELDRLRATGVRIGVAYRVRITITTEQRQQVASIPRAALIRDTDNSWRVFTVSDSRAKLKTVSTGLMNDRLVEVTDGLETGVQVIVAPDRDLNDGDRVRIERESTSR